MTDTAFALIVSYGPVVLFLVTFMSCLALPVPASLMMLAGGGFVASGEIAASAAVIAALAGAVLGDQAGYFLGRAGGGGLERWIGANPHRADLRTRSLTMIDRWGGLGVFFSRWLVSPLGPYVNLIVGASTLSWARFAFWGFLGEAIWVALYVGLGAAFSARIAQLADLLGSASGFLAGLTVSGVLAYVLVTFDRARRTKKARGAGGAQSAAAQEERR